ncbi:hypothetical protein LJC00_00950 [Dysgonomonas sp. OttesenSCG-928-M03]|nr:hypothetical protein [Dysgonomonas sp. OttesenSCG-928-M03]
MKKVKYLYIILIGLFSIALFSCSESSIEDDARKAAELSSISNQLSMEGNINEAGKTYKDVQEIMEKYKRLDKFDEFYQLYISYLHENSYRIEESLSPAPIETPAASPSVK